MNLTHWSQVHSQDPYRGLLLEPRDEEGWNSNAPVFERLIKELRPALVCEVGVWKGASALHMARCLRVHGLTDSRIVCVDTWLGSLEFWTKRDDPERYGALMCRNGYPSVYYQFLSNVVHAGMQETIIPFPNTSAIAAAWMKQAKVEAQLIYLDASHDFASLTQDMRDWWGVLKVGGVMFGDDLGLWPDVQRSIEHVFGGISETVQTEGPKWVVRKQQQ